MRARKIPSGILAVLVLIGSAAWAGPGAVAGLSTARVRAARGKENPSQASQQTAPQSACGQRLAAQAAAAKATAAKLAAEQTASQTAAQEAAQANAPPPPPPTPEEVADDKLCEMVRISVDSFGDDPVAKQIQAMIINYLAATKMFIIMEGYDNTSAIFRGAALARTTGGGKQPSTPGAGGRGGADAGGGSGGPDTPQKGGPTSIVSADVVIDVSLAVRLIAADGTVIWTGTAESNSTSGKGPIEDAANSIVEKLKSDLARLPLPAK